MADRGAWSPLRHSLFRAMWIASVVSNVGTWMHTVGASWLMTTLAASPLLVALVQTATTLPVFLLGLPAGVMADLVDRRKLLIFTQSWMLGVAAVLGVLAMVGGIGPWWLLSLTFALGVGSAMNGPAWAAAIPELVPRDELPAAVALNSVGFNIARAVGPALGGIVMAASGAGAVFMANAVSFLGVIVVLWSWKERPPAVREPGTRFRDAMREGLVYVRGARPFHAILVRAGMFSLAGSALWAMLPVVARDEMKSTSLGIRHPAGMLRRGLRHRRRRVGAFALPLFGGLDRRRGSGAIRDRHHWTRVAEDSGAGDAGDAAGRDRLDHRDVEFQRLRADHPSAMDARPGAGVLFARVSGRAGGRQRRMGRSGALRGSALRR